MQILRIYKENPLYWLYHLTLVLVGTSIWVYVLQKLPASDPSGLACSYRPALTFMDLVFPFVFLALLGILVMSFVYLFQNKFIIPKNSSSVGVLSLLLGTVSAVCTICFLPTLTFLGISIGLSFLSGYSLLLQVLSGIALILSIIQLELYFKRGCKVRN